MGMPFHFKLYRSRPRIEPGSREEETLVAEATEANRVHGVTGYLQRRGDHYVGYLEGATEGMEAIWDRVLSDPRHDEIELLAEGPLRQRRYPGWIMRPIDLVPGTDGDDLRRSLDMTQEEPGEAVSRPGFSVAPRAKPRRG